MSGGSPEVAYLDDRALAASEVLESIRA
jgi:hypothetical protein